MGTDVAGQWSCRKDVQVVGDEPLKAAERAELLRLRQHVGEREKDNAFLVRPSAYFAAMQKNPRGSS